MRRFRFSVRTLLLAFAMATVLLGLVARRCMERRGAVRAIEESGGRIGWTGMYDESPPWGSWLLLSIWPPVERISFVDVDLSDDVWRQVCKIRSIEDLHISATQSDDGRWRHLRHLAGLKSLSITDAPDSVFSDVSHLHGLQRLRVGGKRVVGAQLSFVTELPELRVLNLSDSSVDDDGLQSVGGMVNLEELYLIRTPITDSGIPHLASLKSLKVLNLNETEITDDCLRHINAIHSLEKLNLDCIGLSGERFGELRGLTRLAELEVPVLWLDDSGTAELRAVFPTCKFQARARSSRNPKAKKTRRSCSGF